MNLIIDIHCPECLNPVFLEIFVGDGEQWVEYGCGPCELSWNDAGELM